MRNYLTALLLVVLLSSCSALFSPSRAPRVVFVLGGLNKTNTESRQSEGRLKLIIKDMSAPAFIDNERILFSRDGHTIASYQFSSWAQSPPKRIHDLMVERFANSGYFKSVNKGSGLINGDILINSELRSFYHDARQEPGNVVVSIYVELLDLKNRELLKSRLFNSQIPTSSYDAAGAAASFNNATETLIEEILTWTKSELGLKVEPS
ncbi:MAG: hypothetical protein GYA55_06350 [SAR324 cluster bacterium]|uniref:ABC-type transport auxiliary lipoprotein component domain-containing protein n=1 Tax=SAR324 cluster bacterium TaxID=2024889 RepID=A0A7X9IL98_9DELT|nr:hypothetical protein [SAR324 cluster bacterium]